MIARVLIVILMFGSMVVHSPRADETVSEPSTRLTVLSYNIHHGEGVDGRLDLERIAEVIRSLSPDLVSLQEVDRFAGRTGRVDQAAELARLTGLSVVFGKSMDFDGGEYGNAILSRIPAKHVEVIPLPGEPRSALIATFEVNGGSRPSEIAFVATHLDTSAGPRRASPPLIERWFAERTRFPAILAGDLNAVPTSPTISELEVHWTNATAGPAHFTSPSQAPARQIDFVFVRPATAWRVIESRVIDERIASDHLPILAVLELVEKDGE